jgi:hypothetical protein
MDAGTALRSVRYVVAADCPPTVRASRETATESPKSGSSTASVSPLAHATTAGWTEKAYVHWIKRYIFLHDPPGATRQPTQDSKNAAAADIAVLPCDFAGHICRVRFHGRRRYAAPGAAFTAGWRRRV